jgi:protein phosphatase
MIDSGILDESEARSVPNNMLLQALGVRSRVHPAVTVHSLRSGDVVLLCSDGLTQMLDDAEIVAAIRENEDLGVLCDGLVAEANERGGPDNVTALAARYIGSEPESAGTPEALALRRWKRTRSVS